MSPLLVQPVPRFDLPTRLSPSSIARTEVYERVHLHDIDLIDLLEVVLNLQFIEV
jgi:hypothetical protein